MNLRSLALRARRKDEKHEEDDERHESSRFEKHAKRVNFLGRSKKVESKKLVKQILILKYILRITI